VARREAALTLVDDDFLVAPAARVLREIAAQLAGQVDEIASTMIRAYEAEIPAYGDITDPALKEDVHTVSAALVRSWLGVMSSGEQLSPALLEPMRQGARRRAAQGIDLQSMLRAYRVGIRVMWSEITASPVWSDRAPEGMLAEVATWALDFADRLSTAVAGAYMDESERLVREREHRRSALLNAILAGPSGERIDGPAELATRHSVAVVRLGPEPTLDELETVGQLLEASAEASIWTVRHRSVVAALASPAHRDRRSLIRDLARLVSDGAVAAVGIGGIAEGFADTRASYAEATAALHVGELLGDGNGVYDHQLLAPLIALLEDPERARRFAAGSLAPLGELRGRSWLLPTLESFVVHHGRLKEVAADLGVHVNTVKYRVNELRAQLGQGFADGDRGVSLLLGLRAARVLDAQVRSQSHGTTGGLT
jgi:GGDEF-like domain/PucR C-terminal helix-turn-helix domain